MSKDDRYGAAGDTYGDATDAYGDASDRGRNGRDGRGGRGERDRNGEGGEDGGRGPSDGFDELPFIFARRTVKADRDALPVYVRESTADDIGALERELDGRFDGDDVMSLDVREAVVRAGLRNADDVVAVMEEWGYGRR
ncbi:hypothetical protein [Halegenticoccus tardaugens]|uniref:hypothetical protein n=1 Tax=Halegenticoccus tardaugens TaxID=2071624 RepID=UPI00100BBC57|nr:hypothetical protein [Halegenticoccus tardaugens]